MTTFRTLAGLLTALAVTGPRHADSNEDHVVKAITKSGGWVKRDANRPGNPIIAVHLYDVWNMDEILAGLAVLKDLEVLTIDNCSKATDQGLTHLARLDRLHTVAFSRNSVSEQGIQALGRMKQLRKLRFQCCRGITDTALQALTGCENLETLEIVGGWKVTDAGLKHLGRLKDLRRLVLQFTHATDTGFAELQKALPRCRIER